MKIILALVAALVLRSGHCGKMPTDIKKKVHESVRKIFEEESWRHFHESQGKNENVLGLSIYDGSRFNGALQLEKDENGPKDTKGATHAFNLVLKKVETSAQPGGALAEKKYEEVTNDDQVVHISYEYTLFKPALTLFQVRFVLDQRDYMHVEYFSEAVKGRTTLSYNIPLEKVTEDGEEIDPAVEMAHNYILLSLRRDFMFFFDKILQSVIVLDSLLGPLERLSESVWMEDSDLELTYMSDEDEEMILDLQYLQSRDKYYHLIFQECGLRDVEGEVIKDLQEGTPRPYPFANPYDPSQGKKTLPFGQKPNKNRTPKPYLFFNLHQKETAKEDYLQFGPMRILLMKHPKLPVILIRIKGGFFSFEIDVNVLTQGFIVRTVASAIRRLEKDLLANIRALKDGTKTYETKLTILQVMQEFGFMRTPSKMTTTKPQKESEDDILPFDPFAEMSSVEIYRDLLPPEEYTRMTKEAGKDEYHVPPFMIPRISQAPIDLDLRNHLYIPKGPADIRRYPCLGVPGLATDFCIMIVGNRLMLAGFQDIVGYIDDDDEDDVEPSTDGMSPEKLHELEAIKLEKLELALGIKPDQNEHEFDTIERLLTVTEKDIEGLGGVAMHVFPSKTTFDLRYFAESAIYSFLLSDVMLDFTTDTPDIWGMIYQGWEQEDTAGLFKGGDMTKYLPDPKRQSEWELMVNAYPAFIPSPNCVDRLNQVEQMLLAKGFRASKKQKESPRVDFMDKKYELAYESKSSMQLHWVEYIASSRLLLRRFKREIV